MASLAVRVSALLNRITPIIEVGTKEQVRGVGAPLHIAAMADVEAISDRAHELLIGNAVHPLRPAVDLEQPIPIGGELSNP